LLEQEKRKTDEASRDHHIAKLRTDDSLRVLIVEDNLINQKVLKRQLVKAGFNPDVASDGSQALDLIRLGAEKGERYGVILMDLEMRTSSLKLSLLSCLRCTNSLFLHSIQR